VPADSIRSRFGAGSSLSTPGDLFSDGRHIFSLRGEFRGDHMNRSGDGERQGNSTRIAESYGTAVDRPPAPQMAAGGI
jgi:hypothetical protein